MAHKKAGGSSRNGRDSEGRRLGVKKFGGEFVLAGNIIIRQRGTKVRAGDNVGIGTDHTLFATATGRVDFHVKGADLLKTPELRDAMAVLRILDSSHPVALFRVAALPQFEIDPQHFRAELALAERVMVPVP